MDGNKEELSKDIISRNELQPNSISIVHKYKKVITIQQ